MDDFWKKEEKLAWFAEHDLQKIEFENITPDKNNNWLNQSDNNWDSLIPVCNKDVKSGKGEGAIFKLYTLGTVSNRDEWVYDFDAESLKSKIGFFINQYNNDVDLLPSESTSKNVNTFLEETPIKYTRDLKKNLLRRKKIEVISDEFRKCLYRVFVKQNIYYASELNEMRYQTPL